MSVHEQRLNPEWKVILRELGRIIPNLRGMVLYGSRIAGTARRGSDYDVLAVVDTPNLVAERRGLTRRAREATGLPVDLNVATPRGLALHVLLDPYVRFCLATGIKVGDVPEMRSPLAREGALDALAVIELDIEDADGFSPSVRTKWLKRIAKQIAVLEQALAGDYDPRTYAQRVKELLAGTPEERGASLRAAAARLKAVVDALPPNQGDADLQRALEGKQGGRE